MSEKQAAAYRASVTVALVLAILTVVEYFAALYSEAQWCFSCWRSLRRLQFSTISCMFHGFGDKRKDTRQ